MTNSEILRKMKKIYYPEGSEYLDWMGFKITDSNIRTYHHIVKKVVLNEENKDYTPTISNGAYLSKKSHELLHRIEQGDKDLYEEWNRIFSLIVEIGTYPPDDVWNMIFELQEKSLELDKNKIR